VCSSDLKIIPANEFEFDPIKKTCVCPAGKTLSCRGEKVDEYGKVHMHFQGKLLQCRHCDKKEKCMKNPQAADHRKGSGRQVRFPLPEKRKPNYTDWMKHRIDSKEGKQIYSHRMSVVEPVFGNITTNKKLNRFSLRGKEKVTAQWQLYCVIHNIEKLKNYGEISKIAA